MKTLILASTIAMLCAVTLCAQWTNNPDKNAQLTATEGQEHPRSVQSDGTGGWFILYEHLLINDLDVRLARVDSVGVTMWDRAIAAHPEVRERGSHMVSDAAGGVIVAWYDNREETTTEIYAQRIDSEGSEMWAAGGILVSPLNEEHEVSFCCKLVGDGAGGAIVTFMDDRVFVPEQGYYAQKISAAGNLQWLQHIAWSSNPAACSEDEYDICTDGAGGLYIVFEMADFTNLQNNIRGMHLDAAGERRWSNDDIQLAGEFSAPAGFLIHASQHGMNNARTFPDGNGDVIVLWLDNPGLFEPDIPQHTRGQKLSASGQLLWAAAGSMLNTNDRTAPPVKGAIDAFGNLYFNFHDGDAYRMQRVNPLGEALWENGIIVRDITAGAMPPLVSTSCNDVVLAYWQHSTTDMYAARYDSLGAAVWNPAELRVSAVAGDQLNPIMAIDKNDRMIVLWTDNREYGSSSSEIDIYMQGFTKSGRLDSVVSSVEHIAQHTGSIRVWPNPGHSSVVIELGVEHPAGKIGISAAEGRIVWQARIAAGQEKLELPLESFTAGYYNVFVQYPGVLHSAKLIVE